MTGNKLATSNLEQELVQETAAFFPSINTGG